MQPIPERITARPACPNCGRSMHPARITPGGRGRADVATYGCGECGVWLTQTVGDDRTD